MPPDAKTSYHHGNLRAAILAAALDLLDEEGVEAVTIRAVARSIGVAHSAPANHFKTRKELLTALATQIFETLTRSIQLELSDGPSATRDRVALFAQTVLNFGLSHPNRYRLLWRRDQLDPEDPTLNKQMDALYDPLVATFAASVPEGAPSAETRGIALWSMIHGYVSMRLDGNLIALPDEATGRPREEAILDAVLDGLVPDRPQTTDLK